MSGSLTDVEPKGKKDNLKRRNNASQNEHIEANVEVVDGAVGAKTELQELTSSLKQVFAQMPLLQSFKLLQSELEIPCEEMEGAEQEETQT